MALNTTLFPRRVALLDTYNLLVESMRQLLQTLTWFQD